MGDRMYDVYSEREAGGTPALNNCSLMLGNGQTVIFENGASVAPVSESTARLLMAREPRDCRLVPIYTDDELGSGTKVTVTGNQFINSGVGDSPAASSDADALAQAAEALATATLRIQEADQRASAALKRVEALEAQLNAQGATTPSEGDGAPQAAPQAPQAPDSPPVLTDEQQAAIDAAAAHLREEGEEVPEPGSDVGKTDAAPEVVLPEGFEATTSDDQPRCLGRKGDGTQCANPAKPGTRACAMGKHIEQVAALQAA